MKGHSSSLGDKIVPDLNPAYEIQWKEEEELQFGSASSQEI